ncbi:MULTISPECIES: fosfomycin resistance glutathione transferase [Serratia]|uniref:fosfomycin resistance glutathione transferase n=1 Tax=Serratia TaxID=613 RepID=UPI001013C476|nr:MULTISPECIES: fosfomycin resistance glutathione transferase [Serratia]CAI1556175.1 Glutathione transferase fosA [Serratia ficaria]CAI1632873.1 Glutathione transferase fosA [Serratia ficaria]CAI2018674.1 Glutathione transferase fosA [Serratia ficaria]CAI2451441.1 Glutathione transferase fosA [Serratia ficaria]CAI2452581.1 Glutathione transferase fosA [Serratia ficaria]
MLTGLNHLTLAVTDVDRSLDFYRDLLGFVPHARWQSGAYLSLGELWLCLSLDAARSPANSRDYTHYAFSAAKEQLALVAQRLRQAGVKEWKRNRSEGESLYFLDPDGHQLEIHAGSLASRLAACREKPYQGMTFF